MFAPSAIQRGPGFERLNSAVSWMSVVAFGLVLVCLVIILFLYPRSGEPVLVIFPADQSQTSDGADVGQVSLEAFHLDRLFAEDVRLLERIDHRRFIVAAGPSYGGDDFHSRLYELGAAWVLNGDIGLVCGGGSIKGRALPPLGKAGE